MHGKKNNKLIVNDFSFKGKIKGKIGMLFYSTKNIIQDLRYL